ncbi:MAG: hypothetical protein A4E47_00948 [Methanosaeta sp. PtaU1.Bin028]|nr:MAG: hypothetical protein A4E47_00948 [Methanosaeta sp. PtaU1.Bin028]
MKAPASGPFSFCRGMGRHSHQKALEAAAVPRSLWPALACGCCRGDVWFHHHKAGEQPMQARHRRQGPAWQTAVRLPGSGRRTAPRTALARTGPRPPRGRRRLRVRLWTAMRSGPWPAWTIHRNPVPGSEGLSQGAEARPDQSRFASLTDPVHPRRQTPSPRSGLPGAARGGKAGRTSRLSRRSVPDRRYGRSGPVPAASR